MKKIIVILLAMVMVFGFVSCKAELASDNGLIAVSVNTDRTLAKAISATDVGKNSVTKAYVRFSPVGQGTTYVGATDQLTSGTETFLTKKYEVLDADVQNGVIATKADIKYLTQGQWLVEAVGIDSSSNVLYYGFTNTYISKVNAKISISLTPYNDGTSKGSLKIGTITSEAISSNKAQHRVTYKVYDLTGAEYTLLVNPSETGSTKNILVASAITTSTDSTQEVVTYEEQTFADGLLQGSYVIAMTLEQRTEANAIAGTDTWVTSTGGSATDFGIFKGVTTTVSGDIKPSDYISSTVSATLNTMSDITLTISNSGTTFTASTTTPAGSTSSVTGYMWFVDGAKQTETSATFAYGNSSTTKLVPGEHIIQCVAVGKSSSTATKNDIKSTMKSASVDSMASDVTQFTVTINNQ